VAAQLRDVQIRGFDLVAFSFVSRRNVAFIEAA
jgi:hypothetical protein